MEPIKLTQNHGFDRHAHTHTPNRDRIKCGKIYLWDPIWNRRKFEWKWIYLYFHENFDATNSHSNECSGQIPSNILSSSINHKNSSELAKSFDCYDQALDSIHSQMRLETSPWLNDLSRKMRLTIWICVSFRVVSYALLRNRLS